MRAIISVADREGIVPIAQELESLHVTIYSTSGTRQALQAEGIQAHAVSEITHFPEILDGRVKTLHPAIFSGILARRSQHQHTHVLHEHHFSPIDLVIVNLYPFVDTLRKRPEATLDEVLEQIDIGGVAMIRAAAKNFQDVIVLVRPCDYADVLQEWREQGEVSIETRRRLAAVAFQHTASYDTAIAEYLRGAVGERFPEELTIALERIYSLRYGENPHQQASFYRRAGSPVSQDVSTLASAEVLHGRELSYNNLLDLDTALTVVQSFTAPTVAIIKHTNPCGIACDDVLVEAYKKAHAGDPLSSSGGVVGSNRPIDEITAQQISQLFYAAIIAPDYTPEALQILRHCQNLRLLATHHPIEPRRVNSRLLYGGCPEVRTVGGGLLLQTPDAVGAGDAEYRVVTDREPTLDEITDLMFAWKAVRCVKSNAVVLAHRLMVIGVGAGQMNRVTSVQLALYKADDRARGSVLASDASFPFADSVEKAAHAGITAMIQPGGSLRDEEVIRMANRSAMAMIFTGWRHYRH